jgi:hypothetical protein
MKIEMPQLEPPASIILAPVAPTSAPVRASVPTSNIAPSPTPSTASKDTLKRKSLEKMEVAPTATTPVRPPLPQVVPISTPTTATPSNSDKKSIQEHVESSIIKKELVSTSPLLKHTPLDLLKHKSNPVLTPPATPTAIIAALAPSKDEVKRVGMKLLNDIEGHKYGDPFVDPVPHDIPGYDNIIRRRVDISSLKKQLAEGVCFYVVL